MRLKAPDRAPVDQLVGKVSRERSKNVWRLARRTFLPSAPMTKPKQCPTPFSQRRPSFCCPWGVALTPRADHPNARNQGLIKGALQQGPWGLGLALSGGTLSPFLECSMSSRNRLVRVSSRFALTAQYAAARRYHGACDSKNFQAAGCLRNSASISLSKPRSRFSYE